MVQPQVSGTNGGHTVSLQGLAASGVTLLGRLESLNFETFYVLSAAHQFLEPAPKLSAHHDIRGLEPRG